MASNAKFTFRRVRLCPLQCLGAASELHDIKCIHNSWRPACRLD